ncbi:MAG: hypothetical protein M1828_003977 [Chrysothrix sp. TS-e1954]|nr:MAG: hypothetical protein M1828_003977 [Chrysothrix sp. TS-e1954]
MGITTLGVGAAVAPTMVETWATHYLNRKPRRQKPTAHISYDSGLSLMRKFLVYSSSHTVDDVQAFTCQYAPSPTWIRTEDTDIPTSYLLTAAKHINLELGPSGIHAVGGRTWWQWREEGSPLRAEWIEMKKDYNLRKQRGLDTKRCMFYVHGGAYYFASVDASRYQMQRHARKLQARVFAPRYRLAPQFPFPCGLQDCLAAYLYLLTIQPPETIVVAGDSAGGGMILSMLIILRDQGLPLPAGTVLLSPWVDLTHSFPSVAGSSSLDYIPASGFHHKPSLSWPPPNSDDLEILENVIVQGADGKDMTTRMLRAQSLAGKGKQRASQDATGFSVEKDTQNQQQRQANATPGLGENLSVVIDDKSVVIKDQIQMYTTNEMLAHPLVSPILQPSLGGLPPMCVIVGGGELLRDEQIYLAHKAANPTEYRAPGLSDDDWAMTKERYGPTAVQLQVWEDLCHVAATLSFTRPAKFMYRSIAQFSAWALARSQRSEIRIMDDDEVSIISSVSSDSAHSSDTRSKSSRRDSNAFTNGEHAHSPPITSVPRTANGASMTVGRAGEPLPRFQDFMIRQRVTRHGDIYPLDPPSALPACNMPISQIGVIKSGPVQRWLKAQEVTATKFADEKRTYQARRMRELAESAGGHAGIFNLHAEELGALPNEIGTERPPPSAWAGRRKEHLPKRRVQDRKGSRGFAIWSGWGSKHDEEAVDNEKKKVDRKEDVTMSITKVRPRTSTFGLDQIAGIPPSSSGPSRDSRYVPPSSQSNGAPPLPTTTERASLPSYAAETGQSSGPATTSSLPSTALPPNTPPTISQTTAVPTTTAAAATTLAANHTSPTSPTFRNRPRTSSTTHSATRPDSPDIHDAEIQTATIASVSNSRPVIAGSAVPFKVRRPESEMNRNPSTITLTGEPGIVDGRGETNGIEGVSAPNSPDRARQREAARASSKYGGVDATYLSYDDMSKREEYVPGMEGREAEQGNMRASHLGQNNVGVAKSTDTPQPARSATMKSSTLSPSSSMATTNTNDDASVQRSLNDASSWADRVIRDVSGVGSGSSNGNTSTIREVHTPRDESVQKSMEAAKRSDEARFGRGRAEMFGS